MVTHHASNGCDLRPGDLLGCGTKPFTLANGESRMWLEDGDEVSFHARAERPGFVSLGFGECRAAVAPAVSWPS